MTEQERKKLGAWSSKLPSPMFNNLRVCLINLFKQYGLEISVKELLDKVSQCVKDKGGDTEEQLKKIGLYKGEFQEVQDIQKKDNDNEREFTFNPKINPRR